MSSSDDPPAEDGASASPPPVELAAQLAGRLCHDLISPASAIVSGLDLLEDAGAADMREDAERLIAQSARKLTAQLAFFRVAFGTSTGAESFDPRELETLARGVFAHVRAELHWDVQVASLPKPAAKALLNMAQIGAAALPMGGTARLTAGEAEDGALRLLLSAEGARVRLKAEIQAGLEGRPLGEGLSGYWVQAYYLHATVTDAGGVLSVSVEPERVAVEATLPGQNVARSTPP